MSADVLLIGFCVLFVCLLSNTVVCVLFCFFFFKQKTAYEMRISDWSSDVCFRSRMRFALVVAAQIDDRFDSQRVDGRQIVVVSLDMMRRAPQDSVDRKSVV